MIVRRHERKIVKVAATLRELLKLRSAIQLNPAWLSKIGGAKQSLPNSTLLLQLPIIRR
jgi:hypothetical protein